MILLSFLLAKKDIIELILHFITAFGVVFAGIGILLNKRSEYLSIMDKCTREFRDIIRREAEIKAKSIVDSRLIRNDYLGLFNEQLFYIEKSYTPKGIALEWISTIYDFVVENRRERFSCRNPKYVKSNNIFSCLCNRHQDIECFDRVKFFYDLCEKTINNKDHPKEKQEKNIKKLYNTYYRFPFSKRRIKYTLDKNKMPKMPLIRGWLLIEKIWS